MKLLTTNTFSNAATSDFTSLITSAYRLYIFKWYDVNPATDAVLFGFQGNASSQSGYNETITNSSFYAYHAEADSSGLNDGGGLAQETDFVELTNLSGYDADESNAGELFLFNPSNTTYQTHFYGTSNESQRDGRLNNWYFGGYFNVTAAITNIQFKMSSGNMDGVIKMYGVG